MRLNKLSRSLASIILWLGLPLFAFAQAGLPPSVTVAPGTGGKLKVTFRHNAPGAESVALAGSMNDWNASAAPMAKTGDDFTCTLDLAPGRYEYKFFVNGDTWRPDPLNLAGTDDRFGGKNSEVRIVAEAAGVPEAAKLDKPTSLPLNASSPFPSVVIEPLGNRQSRVTFRYAGKAERVAVAGSFNGWNQGINTMERDGDTFTTTLTLADDVYTYKFVVNGEWKQDEANPEGEDDGHGGKNSVLRLGPGASIRKSEEKTGDGRINDLGLFHDAASVDYFNPLGDGTAVIKLRTLAHDASDVIIIPGNPVLSWGIDMRKEWSDDKFDVWRANASLATMRPDGAGEVSYKFRIADGVTTGGKPAVSVFAADGMAASPDAKPFTGVIAPDKVFRTPGWARHVVWYDLFPERFRNGDRDNDPSTTQLRRWTSDWEQRGPEELTGLYPAVFNRRYGGDIQGIVEKLPYLKRLGIGAIWFNPMFKAESLHKYDATDYRHIDDCFGTRGDWEKVVAKEDLLNSGTWTFTPTDKLFLDMVKKAHGLGIKVVLDGVFNHTGKAHPAFQDLVKNGRQSRFKDWYNVIDWDKPWDIEKTPFTYEGWFGFGGLPVFHEDEHGFVDPTLKQHLFDITARWMDPNGDGDPSDGIDGWRLDVAADVNSGFWREWRALVKRINPDAIIMAEEWDSPRRLVMGDQFDNTMNYQYFAKPLIRYWRDGAKPTELARDIERYRHDIPDQSQAVMMNLTNSHDTERVASMLHNPGRQYDKGNRVQDLKKDDKPFDTSKPPEEIYARVRGMLPLQFAWIGAPMIYYGDEVGMWGPDDPGNRKPMIWQDLEPYDKPEQNRFMREMYDAYHRAAAVRNSLPSLQVGDYALLMTDDDRGLIAFSRSVPGETAVVVANSSGATQEARVPVPAREYVDLFRDPKVRVVDARLNKDSQTRIEIGPGAAHLAPESGTLRVTLPPHTSTILLAREAAEAAR